MIVINSADIDIRAADIRDYKDGRAIYEASYPKTSGHHGNSNPKTPLPKCKVQIGIVLLDRKDVDSLGPSRNVSIKGEHRTDAFSEGLALIVLY